MKMNYVAPELEVLVEQGFAASPDLKSHVNFKKKRVFK